MDNNIFFEQDGRKYKKEPFTKMVPRYTFLSGKFSGKFHSEKTKNEDIKEEFFDFKIYEGEVEIIEKSKFEFKHSSELETSIKIDPSQLPDKIHFFERKEDQKKYFNLSVENPVFRNFKFVSELQQNEGEEAFGTVHAEFYGYVIDYLPEKYFKKRYALINLIKSDKCIETDEETGKIEINKEGLTRKEYWCKCKRKTFWGEWFCDKCIHTNDKTGEKEIKGECYREEYWCKGNTETYWGEWICKECIETSIKTGKRENKGKCYREEYWCEGKNQTYLGEWICPPKIVNTCLRNLLLSLGLIGVSLFFSFTPTFIIGLIWLFYVIYNCYFSYLKYLAYLFGILFLVSLVFSILNTNWKPRKDPYLPKIVEHSKTKPILVKEIKLLSKDGKNNDVLIKRKMVWYGYFDEKYVGEYFIKNSDLNQSTDFKNQLSEQIGYPNVLYQLQQNDKDKLGSLYEMFSKIRTEKKLNDKRFAEMMVCFVQQIPYYLVLEKSCNAQDYQENFVKNMLQENPGKCSPHQKFGITSPTEFMGNLQGDCDSRTLLLHTIMKHFQYDAIIISSDVYHHSMLGVNLPYSGQSFNTNGSKYTVWETTSPNFIPGNIPLQVSNMNNWYLTLK